MQVLAVRLWVAVAAWPQVARMDYRLVAAWLRSLEPLWGRKISLLALGHQQSTAARQATGQGLPS